MIKGHIKIYTGNGKGKTTSALGLAIKAMGAEKKVFIGQFLKSGKYSEINSLKKFSDLLTLEHYGLGRFVEGKPTEEDIKVGIQGYHRIAEIIKKGKHDLVIVDEGNVAVKYRIISEQQLLDLFDMKPDHVEIVVTGRGATAAVIARADLVIKMKAIKHYFKQGVEARVGIEK